MDNLLQEFTTQEFRDLQVWFNLTWTGHRARKESEVLRALLKKGRDFSEAEKASLLKSQQEIIQKLIPLYQSLRSRGQVEITVSPFYHPILPLLMDWQYASRAMPRVALPGFGADSKTTQGHHLYFVTHLFQHFHIFLFALSEGNTSEDVQH